MSTSKTVAVAISKHTNFNPVDPEATRPSEFTYLPHDCRHETWEAMGYTFVGSAEIDITFHDRDSMTLNAIKTLEIQRDELKAKTALAIADLDDQIKRLQAITHQVDVA